jgi:hypothetical protein
MNNEIQNETNLNAFKRKCRTYVIGNFLNQSICKYITKIVKSNS